MQLPAIHLQRHLKRQYCRLIALAGKIADFGNNFIASEVKEYKLPERSNKYCLSIHLLKYSTARQPKYQNKYSRNLMKNALLSLLSYIQQLMQLNSIIRPAV